MFEEKRGNITTIIFDMDGTLIDSEPVYMRELVQFLHKNKIQVEKDELYSVIGRDTSYFWHKMTQWFPESYSLKAIQEAYNTRTIAVDYRDLLFPHVHRMLKELKNNNYRIALASASPIDNIKTVLAQCELASYFDYIVSGKQVKHNKPAPDIYLHVMEHMQCNADEVLIIEDSTNGLKAAVASGASVVAKLDTRYHFEQDLAEVIIADYLELLNLLHI